MRPFKSTRARLQNSGLGRECYETLSDLPEELLAPLFGAARRLARACETGLGAEGAFVGLNNRVSQSVKHVHVHIVPRRRGDGLRGFFWPRRKYRDDVEMAEFAERLRRALGESPQ